MNDDVKNLVKQIKEDKEHTHTVPSHPSTKIDKKLQEFDEIMINLPVNTSALYFEGINGEKIETARMATVKQFLRQALQQQKDHYEKELKIADDRWERNEKYHEQYMDGYAEEKTAWKQELIEEIEKKRKKGIEEVGEAYSCKECGGYDECDCSGYNQALDDIIDLIKNK